jgi:hypothetical protein
MVDAELPPRVTWKVTVTLVAKVDERRSAAVPAVAHHQASSGPMIRQLEWHGPNCPQAGNPVRNLLSQLARVTRKAPRSLSNNGGICRRSGLPATTSGGPEATGTDLATHRRHGAAIARLQTRCPSYVALGPPTVLHASRRHPPPSRVDFGALRETRRSARISIFASSIDVSDDGWSIKA